MKRRQSVAMTLIGTVGLTAAQCGYSTDMLTTVSTDSEGDSKAETENEGNVEEESDSEAPETADCPDDGIEPAEVLLIGDSWISLPGARVGELARTAGIIELDEDYVYRAAAGATIEMIVAQYDNYTSSTDADVKVVIMNGGAVDTYGVNASEESITHVAGTFEQFLDQLAEESDVEHVIYALYSEGSTIPGIVELRPLMGESCAKSVVPCHFLDLQPLWEDHPEYTSMDTINPSSTGSDAIAGAIWEVMQENCIAQ